MPTTPAANPEVTNDPWRPVAVDGVGRVIEEDVLVGFFADPIGTFNGLIEWPARLLIISESDVPQPDEDGLRSFRSPIRRSDILWDFDAEIAPAPDTEIAWKTARAIAAAANSTKKPLPSGPTGGY